MKTKEQMQFDITDLNEGQKQIFEQLKIFMTKKDCTMVCLRGFAGTGKTFLIKRFIKYLHVKYPSYRIAMTGPTNKSVKVLAKASGMKDTRVSYQTVHKLLGLKEDIQNDGKIKFTKSFSDKNEIDQYKVLIVDEVSMLDDELFVEIQANSKRLKIIFMGDAAQIPPVNRPDCIPFNPEKNIYYDFMNCSLSEIMRQSQDNPIIQSSFQIRNNLTKNYPIDEVHTSINSKGDGVIRLDANKDSDRAETMKLFEKYFKCKAFEQDPDHAKVIAWRNKTIDKTNSIIRSILYGKDPGKIMLGEKLICNKPIMDGLNIIIFTTNDELSVEEFNVASDIFVNNNGKNRLNYYDTTVLSFDLEGREIRRRIKILHESSQNDFDTIANSLKNTAIEQKGAHRSWPKYYEFLRMFADVGYNYGITAHKCISPDQLISTKEKGLIPIIECEKGMHVKTGFGGFKKIIEKFKTKKKEEYIIETKTGIKLKCSKEHPFLSLKNGKHKFIKLKNLSIGDNVCISREILETIDDQMFIFDISNVSKHIIKKHYEKLQFPKKLDEKISWLIGILIGDGAYSDYKLSRNRSGDNGLISISFNVTERKQINKTITILRSFGLNPIERLPKNNCVRLDVSSIFFKKYLRQLGLNAYDKPHNKIIPQCFFKTSLKNKIALIKGLFDSDGHINKKSIIFTSVSRQLIEDLKKILLEVGIISNIHYAKKSFQLVIISPKSFKLFKNIGFTEKRKDEMFNFLIKKRFKTNIDNIPNIRSFLKEEIKAKLPSGKTVYSMLKNSDSDIIRVIFYNRGKINQEHLILLKKELIKLNINIPIIDEILERNYFYDEIKEIRKTGEIKEMIDIEVEDHHSFVSESFVVHNSQGSTYKNVFILEDDICQNPNVVERNRILYTSYSRASEKLFIIKK